MIHLHTLRFSKLLETRSSRGKVEKAVIRVRKVGEVAEDKFDELVEDRVGDLEEDLDTAVCCPDHARVNRELPLVDDFGFDVREKAVLDIIRHLSCGLVVSAYDGTGKALERASQEWTDEGSRRMVQAVAYLLARLQAIRTIAFEFIVVDCPLCRKHICQSELQLLLLLRAGRRNDPYRLVEAAKLVAASGDPSGLMVAARTLGSVMKDCDKFMLTATGNSTLH